MQVFNSGLEAWLYDDANTDAIREQRVRRALIGGGKTDGQIVGYSLQQDDALNVDIVVGPSLTVAELSVSRWLDPQRAFLRLPSGRLAIESNDACRVGEEEPTEKGAVVSVPPGEYRVTLHRVDYEALERDEMAWDGAQEIVVLTPGGSARDDVAGLLPFTEKFDLDWVGRIQVSGRTARGLVWFDDHWDTYFANIDSASAEQMGLVPGRYLRTSVPAAEIELVTVFARSWEEGAKLRPPAGITVAEFGYGSVITPERWEGREALLSRRVKAAKAIHARNKKLWLDATFEVLDVEPESPPARLRGPVLLDTPSRAFWHAKLADRNYFDGDQYTLAMKLDTRVEGVNWGDPLTLAEAVERIDETLAGLGLTPLGDFSFDLPGRTQPIEYTVRVYRGTAEYFAAVWASAEAFEICFFSRIGGSKWILASTIDEDEAEQVTKTRPRISMFGQEEETSLADLLSTHREQLADLEGEPDIMPGTLEEIAPLYDDYLTAALG